MKDFSIKKAIWIFFFPASLIHLSDAAVAQCKQRLSESTKRNVTYQDIPLQGKHEYLTFSNSGREKMFSYHNEDIDLVFHVQMFTEIRFFSSKGDFSLFTTTSDRTRWNRCFTLSAPLTSRELEKMKGIFKIEIILPEDHKVFSFDTNKINMLEKAVACLF